VCGASGMHLNIKDNIFNVKPPAAA
jgi:hypothetical protein